MKSSRTRDYLYIMVNYAHKTSRIRERYTICSKYAGSDKFNVIPREENPEISINYYKDQFRENMIRNGMWNIFSLIYPQNKEKKWDVILYQSRIPLEYGKLHAQSIQKGSEADKYVVQT